MHECALEGGAEVIVSGVAASFHHFQRGAPTMARCPRNDPTVFPAARPQTPSGGKGVIFLAARFPVHASLCWAFESDAFEVRREGGLR